MTEFQRSFVQAAATVLAVNAVVAIALTAVISVFFMALVSLFGFTFLAVSIFPVFSKLAAAARGVLDSLMSIRTLFPDHQSKKGFNDQRGDDVRGKELWPIR